MPFTPVRILDTRLRLGAPSGLAPPPGWGGGTRLGRAGLGSVGVLGGAGVPASGVSAVILNVTVTNPSAYGYITAWPHGVPRPLASNLNFRPGQTVANRAVVGV